MEFLASCVMTIILGASLTGGNVIPQLRENGAENTQILDTVGISSLLDALSSDSETVIQLEVGQDVVGQQSGKRSISSDTNLSGSPAAFAIAEDLSGADLAQILQGLMSESDGVTVPSSIGCTGEPQVSSSTVGVSSYTPQECAPEQVPAIDYSHANTRGLCPWTYVENTDIDRYPSTLLYAQCSCSNCVRQNVSDDFGCHPIYHDTKVLRKHSCQGGIQIYEAYYERVPVACACLHTKEIEA